MRIAAPRNVRVSFRFALAISNCRLTLSQICHFELPRRMRHKARPNTARPTASAGTKVTTRLPSGVDHDTAPAVRKAAIRPLAMATRGNLGCGGSRLLVSFMSLPSSKCSCGFTAISSAFEQVGLVLRRAHLQFARPIRSHKLGRGARLTS